MKSTNAEKEEQVLKFWKDREIFKKTLEKDSPKGDFVFFEGPPTANGKPGIHHVEARVFKDVIPRYKTMRGFRVLRKAGWDTHGLPVELQVEKQLNLSSKKDIEEYGIAKFNKECKKSVFEYIDLWQKFTERVGYWADLDNAYFTFNTKYIETLWNIVSKIDEQNLLYKDYKIVPWCARCGTTLSSHELAQGYQDVKDLSVYVKFEIEGRDKEFILAWTTTPWTLPGNVALAINEKINYSKIKMINDRDSVLIIASSRLSIIDGDYEILEEVSGESLIGLSYRPLYPYLKESLPESEKTKLDKAFKVYGADFVTVNDGTGVVHTAVMYGADDFDFGNKIGLPKYHIVDTGGHFKDNMGFLSGKFVKTEDVAVDIIKDLSSRGLLFKKEKYEHSYPHCWRCKTPLIYYARDSWYIGMSKLREDMISENEKINWEPSYIKNGRFGEWLKEVKDWAISRERYWGTPLPVWFSEDGSEKLIVDSLDTLKTHIKRSGNKYILMRHAEAESNVKGIHNSDMSVPYHITLDGKKVAKESAEKLKKENIDFVFCSPFMRTKETAEIVVKELGIPEENIIYDNRIAEERFGKLSELPVEEFRKVFANFKDRYFEPKMDSEPLNETRKRLAEFIYELDSKYSNKNILIITHGGPISVLRCIADGKADIDSMRTEYFNDNNWCKPGYFIDLDFAPFPKNDEYELDLHRPYIDEVVLEKNGKRIVRVKEVMDVWFDSGAMPFAQSHYPFDFNNGLDMNGNRFAYPADFISEAIDQTRGWFYTLHAVGALMKKGRAYNNVICLGHLLDKNGKKMSKSLGNVIDPWEQIEKFGIDAIRLWMYSVNQPGESKNYDERTVDEINKKIFNLITNVYSFYELYRDKTLEWDTIPSSSHLMDKWLLIRLSDLIESVTKHLDNYKLFESVRLVRLFIEDLSTWYLQLSRDRFREGDAGAKQTLYFVLKNLSKILAPFAPFFTEDLYQKLLLPEEKESVHLNDWPKNDWSDDLDKGLLLKEMQSTREAVSLGLDARMKANIKVRQPLSKLTIRADLKVSSELVNLIADRVNVKEVVFDGNEEARLDTLITKELKDEGILREIIRFVQDIRKRQNLTPKDLISMKIGVNQAGKEILNDQDMMNLLKSAVLAKDVSLSEDLAGELLNIDEVSISVNIY